MSRLKRQWQGRIRFFFRDQAGLKRYSRLKNQSASIDASWSRIRCFFSVSEQVKKILGVGGKQAEPGVSSGFWIHRTPPNSVKWFVLTSTLTSTDDQTTIYSVFWVKTFILMILWSPERIYHFFVRIACSSRLRLSGVFQNNWIASHKGGGIEMLGLFWNFPNIEHFSVLVHTSVAERYSQDNTKKLHNYREVVEEVTNEREVLLKNDGGSSVRGIPILFWCKSIEKRHYLEQIKKDNEISWGSHLIWK